jgi:transcriptional regulator with XRE-family HTH domain
MRLMQGIESINSKTQDFRLLLQQEFVRRCRKNESYSLRSYAKSLAIEPSPLSAILRGKRPITEKTKTRLGLALGLGLEDLKKFSASSSKSEFQQLDLDNYAVISDWYHYAILELIRLKTFCPNSAYVAKKLNISQTEAHIAIERLQRIGLLEIKKNGKWVDTSANGLATNINEDLTSQAARKLQRQIHEKAIEALETLPTSVRSHTSMTMAIHPDDLPEAKEMIKKFRRELCAHFEKNGKPKEIYHLGVALYPVTNNSEDL